MDGRARNERFARALDLSFPLLSDEKKTVSRQYGVLIPIIRVARRATFVIDKAGVIRRVMRGGEALDPKHALEACAMLGTSVVGQ